MAAQRGRRDGGDTRQAAARQQRAGGADQAARQQDDQGDQSEAQHQRGLAADHPAAEPEGQAADRERADEGAEQAAAAADQDVDRRQQRLLDAEDVGVEVGRPATEQRAGDPGDRSAEREQEQALPAHVVAQELGLDVVLTHRDHDQPERPAHQPGDREVDRRGDQHHGDEHAGRPEGGGASAEARGQHRDVRHAVVAAHHRLADAGGERDRAGPQDQGERVGDDRRLQRPHAAEEDEEADQGGGAGPGERADRQGPDQGVAG